MCAIIIIIIIIAGAKTFSTGANNGRHAQTAALAWQDKRLILFKKASFIRRITAACTVFVTIQASLLVKKANEILGTIRNTNRKQQTTFL